MTSAESTAGASAPPMALRVALWVGQVILMGMFLMPGA